MRSTIDGIVLAVPVKEGSSVIQANTFNDGTTIATVADMRDLLFVGKVDETEVGMLAIGMPLTVTVGAIDGVTSEATIEYISPKASEDNGASTFELKAALVLPDSVTMRSGYSANGSVILNRAKDVVAVPESVIEFEGGDSYVYVLTDSVGGQKFDRRKIETGIGNGLDIEVKNGVDTTVVLRGAEKK